MGDIAGAYLGGVRSGQSLVQSGFDNYERIQGYRDKLKSADQAYAETVREADRQRQLDQLAVHKDVLAERHEKAQEDLNKRKTALEEAETTGLLDGKPTESARHNRAMESVARERADKTGGARADAELNQLNKNVSSARAALNPYVSSGTQNTAEGMRAKAALDAAELAMFRRQKSLGFSTPDMGKPAGQPAWMAYDR